MSKYKDPVHRLLNLLESENINPGNLLIGQVVDIKVTDAAGNQFLRSMEVGEFYPDGQVLVKDVTTQDVIVLQFQHDTAGINGLVYRSENPFGVKYELVIENSGRNLYSNQSITTLNESSQPKLGRREFIYGSNQLTVTLLPVTDDEGEFFIVGMNDTDGEFEDYELFQTSDKNLAKKYANKIATKVKAAEDSGRLDRDLLSWKNDLARFARDNTKESVFK